MTSAEFQKLAAVEATVARIEERLTMHMSQEQILWQRRQGLAPWISNLAALAAVALSLVSLLR
jgi:protoheme ferro-lyase